MLQLFTISNFPSEIAVSKTDSFVDGGAFFLDFSRPIEAMRWLGVRNRWLGSAVGLLVPVVHQGEQHGEYVIGVDRHDPSFSEVRALWKAHLPSSRDTPVIAAHGLKINTDFATQFPDDCS